MTTEVIILAQGVQSRLPGLAMPKQWLPLPACGNTPIVARTLVQLWHLMKPSSEGRPNVTVVCWQNLRELISSCRHDALFIPRLHSLIDPGNSSLKGAKAALEDLHPRWGIDIGANDRMPDRMVILLGDVVYSWACLEVLLSGYRAVVAGTSDLSASGGELWGIAWPKTWGAWMYGCLTTALENHPKFTTYQPGQMRRWYWAAKELSEECRATPPGYVTVDDYTDDVDVPADVANLPKVAEAAAADDLTRGITWPL